MAIMSDFTAKKKLYKRENGSYYLFSEDNFNDHLSRANGVIAAYNGLTKALAKLEELEEKAKDKDYILGVIFEGGEFVRNEYRRTLEKELKGISFFKARRKVLIEESVSEIPLAIFETIDKYRGEASREGSGLRRPIQDSDLTLKLADDGSCVWVVLKEEYKEDLKASLIVEVPEEKIKACEKFIEAMQSLRELEQEGAVLYGSYMPNGLYSAGVMERFISRNTQGEYSKDLSLDDVVNSLYIKPKK